MKKLKKILSTILTLVLFLNMIPQVKAAEGDVGKLTMTASSTAVSHGETVTVTVASNWTFTTRGAGMTIAYDPAALEPILTDSTAKEGFQVSGPMTVNGKTVLRISSFPGEEGHTVNEDEPLAVLAFRTLTPGENIQVEMTAAYLYDENLSEIGLLKADPVQIQVKAVAVTGITLEMETMDLEIGESRELKAKITPENASDKTITWTSSDETKVTVADGVLTALAITEEAVTITASAGGFTATCSVNVVYPPDAGYVITMPMDRPAVVGETVIVSPVVGNKAKDVTVFNAYDMTFTYDPAKLLFIPTEMEDVTVTTGEGTVNLIHYGPDKAVGSAPFTLTFQTLKTGPATVTLQEARVDHSENAIISNAAKAYCEFETMTITVGGYPVALPDEFNGASVAEPGKEYAFEARNKLYDYTFEGSTMGGQSVTVIDKGNGIYAIENVTGDLEIHAQKTGKTFEVVLGTDMTGNSTAQYMTDYSATLHEEDNCTYKMHITINGSYYDGFRKDGDTYTIPGEDITGKIIFTVTKTAVSTPTIYHKVTFQGTGAGAASENATTVANGKTYTFTLKEEEGYLYTVTYQMGSRDPVPIWPNAEGKYSVANVTNALVINIEKQQEQPHDRVEVVEYITLRNEKTMYLVLVYETPDSDQIYTYQDEPMYYSHVYHAWCILTPESDVLTAEIAETKLKLLSGEMTAIGSAAFDVNMTGLVDINDAQLAYDLYNGKYENFKTINMHRFLNADVNVDRKITVADAAAIASEIK